MDGFDAALVEEGAKKSGLLWITLPGLAQPRAAWHIWHDGAVYLVTGGEGEQPLPGLPEADRVTVTLRSKDKGGRLIAFVAAVSLLTAGTEEWTAVLPALMKERLNALSHEDQEQRWATESYVVKLTPAEPVAERVEDYATVRPVPTPATTAPPNPFMVGGKRRRVDR